MPSKRYIYTRKYCRYRNMTTIFQADMQLPVRVEELVPFSADCKLKKPCTLNTMLHFFWCNPAPAHFSLSSSPWASAVLLGSVKFVADVYPGFCQVVCLINQRNSLSTIVNCSNISSTIMEQHASTNEVASLGSKCVKMC